VKATTIVGELFSCGRLCHEPFRVAQRHRSRPQHAIRNSIQNHVIYEELVVQNLSFPLEMLYLIACSSQRGLQGSLGTAAGADECGKADICGMFIGSLPEVNTMVLSL
jgi:hypothetical protein